MIESPARPDHPTTEPNRWTRRRRLILRVVIVLVVLALLFYGGAGWYFSTQLGDDVFAVTGPSDDEFEVEVLAIDAETITLSVPAGDEPTLGTRGVNGYEHTAGRLRLGDVVTTTTDGANDIATRRYEVLVGVPPQAGDLGDLDSWTYPDDPTFLFPDVEMVQFEAELGALDGWFIPGTGDTWVVLVHGKGATRRETLRMMSELPSMPMLTIAYRNDEGQPRDPSGYYQYGVTEWRDVEAAVRWALDQGADEIVLAGFSTGAALDMAFMYRSDLADHIVGIVLDAPNIDVGRTVDYGASQRDLPLIGLQVPQSLATVAKFIGSLRFGIDWSELDYVDDIDTIDVPILVFHGTADTTAPADVSERLAESRPDLVTLQLIEGAEHVQSWNVDPGRYADALRRFLDSL